MKYPFRIKKRGIWNVVTRAVTLTDPNLIAVCMVMTEAMAISLATSK